MIKLTEIINKPIISISSGVILGAVENAVFNKKLCLTHLSVFDREKSNAVLIPASRILHAENNAVIIKNITISNSTAQVNCPLNATVYLYDGSIYDTVNEIILNKDFSLKEIRCAGGKLITYENIISFSKNAVIVCFCEETAQQLKKIKPARKPRQNAVSTGNNIIDKDILSPRKIVPKFNYLIGRKVTKTVHFGDKVIAPANSIITSKTIDICRKYGKLIALARNNKAVITKI